MNHESKIQPSNSKKILLLNYEFPPLGGGASPVSFELAKHLTEGGAERSSSHIPHTPFNIQHSPLQIDAVTMGFKGLPEYEEVNPNFRIHRVKCWRSKKEICHPWEQLTYLFTGYKKCVELLQKNTYDVCH